MQQPVMPDAEASFTLPVAKFSAGMYYLALENEK
jgi:hypothetical protein